jgi:hypothetical protein
MMVGIPIWARLGKRPYLKNKLTSEGLGHGSSARMLAHLSEISQSQKDKSCVNLETERKWNGGPQAEGRA